MSLILSGTDGLSDVDGSAATPAIRGTDANTGIFFGTDIIGFSEGGAEVARFNADSQFVAAAGTAALPVITTTGDVNTGIFFPAADTIAFTEGGVESMRIDSSGNVGIGTSSPAVSLDVWGSSSVEAINYTQRLSDTKAYNANPGAGVMAHLKYNSSGSYAGVGGWSVNKENATDGNFASYMVLATRPAGGGVTERARIDSSGRLLIGTTSSGSEIGLLTVKQSFDGDGGGLRLIAPNSSNAWAIRTGTDNALYFGYNGTSKANINSSSGAYSALSDARLKINVIDSVKGLSVVAALRPVEYNMKDDPTGANQIGLIAQEVLEVLPEVVSIPATEDYFYGMNYAGVVPVLIKAIQEQQVLITALTARITALETP